MNDEITTKTSEREEPGQARPVVGRPCVDEPPHVGTGAQIGVVVLPRRQALSQHRRAGPEEALCLAGEADQEKEEEEDERDAETGGTGGTGTSGVLARSRYFTKAAVPPS